MATPSLSDDELRAAVEAIRAHGGNTTEAAISLGVSRTTLQHRLQLALGRGLTTRDVIRPKRPRMPEVYQRLPQTADECWALIDAAIGRTAKTVKPPKPAKARFSDKRIAIISDLHAPFHDVEAVGQMFHETQGFDVLKINGDLMDSYALSRFTHHESVPIEREMAAVDAILGQASAQFPEIDINDGNHDKPRFEKALRSQLSLDLMHALEYITEGNLSLIRVAAKRYKNIAFPRTQVGRFQLGWFQQDGDLLMAHAEKFSRVPGAALRVIEEWFSDRHDTLGLAPWRVLIQAHTHQMGWFPWHADKLLIESGCLCTTHGYQLDAKIAGRPQRVGYVTLHQRDGVTDINSIRLRWLDAERKAA